MFAISPTDNNWFTYLKEHEYNSYVNFWTPTPWNIRGLKANDKLYFMLKSPIRKIGGFGEFVEYKNITADAAWNEFGYRNGRETKTDFLKSLEDYIRKNSEKLGKEKLNPISHKIGCIVLKNCEFWDSEFYKSVKDYDLQFPPQVVTIKYFNTYNPFLKETLISSFNLVAEPREQKKTLINTRSGQNIFKASILKAYNNTCCVTGEIIPELLEAAHIQAYKNSNSNHVQNGLLLRKDVHCLFDNNLLFIDRNYKIYVSNLIISDCYRQYHGNEILLPSSIYEYPSIEALEARRNEFRN